MQGSVLGVLWGTERATGATYNTSERGSIMGEEVESASVQESPESLLEGHGSHLCL